MKEVEDDSIRIDQLPLSNLYFRGPLKNATGCDLFNSSGYKQTERFHFRLGCPHKVPKGHKNTQAHTHQRVAGGGGGELLFAHQPLFCRWDRNVVMESL